MSAWAVTSWVTRPSWQRSWTTLARSLARWLTHPPTRHRYQRVGGYQLGDTSKLAEKLPESVQRYFGMRVADK